MTTRTATLAIFLLLPVLQMGCKGTTHRVADVEDQGLISTDHIGLNEIRPAVEEMCAEISRMNGEGWAAHVLLTPDAPHKPQVFIDKIKNRTAQRFDLVTLKNELLNSMTRQGAVYVMGDEGDLEAVNQERDYTQSGMTGNSIEYGTEDATALILRGEITDDIIRQGNIKQHDYIFSLRLVDTVKRRVMVVTSTKIRKVREG